jgi:aminopeptidase N
MLFHFRTKVRFIIDGRAVDREISVDSKQHDFYFALAEEPQIVRFDPDCGLLARLNFEKPAAMLYAQLDNKHDVIGRLRAIDALKKKNDRKTIAELKDVLNNDPFHGVRSAASRALREIHNNEAFNALLESADQPDARVRRQVVRDICGFYRPESLELIRRILRKEKNPAILEVAIRNLGLYHHKKTRRLLLKYLRSKSFRNEPASAAIEGIRMLDEPFFIAPLQQTLTERARQFRSSDMVRGLDTLAHIARNEEDKSRVRDFLAGYVNHPRRRLQSGAIRALGTLGDPKAIPIIETFTSDEPGNTIERVAEGALRALQERKPLVPQEIVQLREAVEKLKTETDKLRDELDDINNRLDAKQESAKEKADAETSDSHKGSGHNDDAAE